MFPTSMQRWTGRPRRPRQGRPPSRCADPSNAARVNGSGARCTGGAGGRTGRPRKLWQAGRNPCRAGPRHPCRGGRAGRCLGRSAQGLAYSRACLQNPRAGSSPWHATPARMPRAGQPSACGPSPKSSVVSREAGDRPEPSPLSDERLRLMFVCAHPAIDPSVRTALILRRFWGSTPRASRAPFLFRPPRWRSGWFGPRRASGTPG